MNAFLEKKKKKKSQSPLALHIRKPIDFQESPRQKTSPGPVGLHNNVMLKDNKFKDKLLGYVHKNRENRERIRSMANKVTSQLKLKVDSDDSQESEFEGYNEKLSEKFFIEKKRRNFH